MTEHSKTLSFSSSSRLIACPASNRMSQGALDLVEEGEPAILGTNAHALGEYCIVFGFEPSECIGMTFYKDVKVDQYMADAVEVYVNRIRTLQRITGCKAMVEQRVVMTSLGRDDVFGTSDGVLIDVVNRKLYIDDYKHGFGIVEATTPQLIGYAIATMDTFKLHGLIDTIECTVTQPRASHIDGPIRSVTYTYSELIQTWLPVFQETVKAIDDINTKPSAGPHCKYCPAQAHCRARMMRVLDLAFCDKNHEDLSNQELEVILENTDNIRRYCDAIEQRALAVGKRGYRFHDFKVVDSITRAKLTDEEYLVKTAKEHNVDVEKLYNKKPISMTQAKKLLPWQEVNKAYTKPEPSPTLVRMNDNRPAKSNSVKGVFEPIQQ